MIQATFWANLFYGYFFIVGEEYLFALMGFIILTLIFACLIKRFLIDS